MDTPKVGDIVRVVIEGKVTDTDTFIQIGEDRMSANAIVPSADHVKSIEILTPAKPSVAGLPEGSVVLSGHDGKTPFARLVPQSKYWYEPGQTDAYVAEVLDKWGWTLLVEKSDG
jgi:hypothetical protein